MTVAELIAKLQAWFRGWSARRRERKQYDAMTRHVRWLEHLMLRAGACRQCAGDGELRFLDTRTGETLSEPCTACGGQPFPMERILEQP